MVERTDTFRMVARFVQRHRGVILPAVVAGMIFVILVPLPSAVVDLLLVTNITVGALILLTSVYVIVGDAAQASTAVGLPVAVGAVDAPHWIVVSRAPAASENTGGRVSTIVIVCVPLDLLPHLSVAVHVRVIVPVPPQPVSDDASE